MAGTLKVRLQLFLWGLLLLGIDVGDARATQTDVISLNNAIQMALNQNLSLVNAKLDVTMARKQQSASVRSFLPQLSLTAVGVYWLSDLDMTFQEGMLSSQPPIPPHDASQPIANRWSANILVRARQPLTGLFRIAYQWQQFKLQTDWQKRQLTTVQLDLIHQVRFTYYKILQVEQALSSALDRIKYLSELHAVVQQRHAQHRAIRVDVWRVEARLQEAQLHLLELQNHQRDLKEKLNILLGYRDFEQDFAVEPLASTMMQLPSLDQAQKIALSARTELQQLDVMRRQHNASIKEKISQFIPDLSVQALYVRSEGFKLMPPKNVGAVLLMLDWDVFDWGRQVDQLAKRRALLQRTQNERLQLTDKIRQEIVSLYRQFRQGQMSIEVAKVRERATAENLRVVTMRYKAKLALISKVLEVQSQLTAAQAASYKAYIFLWETYAALQRALGNAQAVQVST